MIGMVATAVSIKAMLDYRKEKSKEKLQRLVDGKPKHSDERVMVMDIKKIEAYGDGLMDRIPDDTKVMSVCLKFIEVRDKLNDKKNILDEDV